MNKKLLIKIYEKVELPIAYVLIVAAICLTWVQDWLPTPLDQRAQFTAVFALLGILISFVHQMHRQMTPSAKQMIFENLDKAAVQMSEALLSYARKNRCFRIVFLGVTMGQTWDILQKSIRSMFDYYGDHKLEVEICMLDPEWEEINSLNPYWKTRITSSKEMIDTFKKNWADKLISGECKIDTYCYRHVPNWYGLLIDGKILFQGSCSWRHNEISETVVTENPVEYYVDNDDFGGTDKINQFQSWIDYCRITDERNRRESSKIEAFPPE